MKNKVLLKGYISLLITILICLISSTILAFNDKFEIATNIILTILTVITIPTLFYLPIVHVKSEAGEDVKFSLKCKIEFVVITILAMILTVAEGYFLKGLFTCSFGEVMLLVMLFNVILVEFAEKRYGHFVKYDEKYQFDNIRQFYRFMNSLEKI